MSAMDGIIKDIVVREAQSGIYGIRIDNVSIYSYARQIIRREYLISQGIKCMELVAPVRSSEAFKTILVSLRQLIGLRLSRKKYSNVFFAFSRLDKISGNYCDKFTDPYIDCGCVGPDYIIFENGRAGKHPRPRTHGSSVIYMDWITFQSRVLSTLLYPFFRIRYHSELKTFGKCLEEIYGENLLDTGKIFRRTMTGLCTSRIYKTLFKRICAERIFAPARPVNQFIAAHKAGMKCYEMQHGITYGETILYSGESEAMSRPDKFLAFGKNKPDDVYGISPKDIVVVGWPLPEYLEKVSSVRYGADDFLIISEPQISDSIIDAILLLAAKYPKSGFYLRPHPLESYDKCQMDRIESLPNVHIQDNHINIFEAMMGFENVIGENSSVLYEALSIGKKVGKLFIAGLAPRYLQTEDVTSFWEIRQECDLADMLVGKPSDKACKSIYAPFDKILFSNALNDCLE